jgi:hypothetical protein
LFVDANRGENIKRRGASMSISIEHNPNSFMIRSDGTFHVAFGGIEMDLLKAQNKNGQVVYPFQGVCSTQDRDLEGEILIQKGLNFEPFMQYGEFNWNHIPFAMVGVPVGKKAWFEDPVWKSQGEIIGGLTALKINGQEYTTDQIVQQHNALKKSGCNRGLCQSVEGKVIERSECGKFVKKANIVNVALTFQPINGGTNVDMLAKSFAGKAEIVTSDRWYEGAMGNLPAPAQQEITNDEVGVLAQKLRDRLMLKKGMNRLEAEAHVWKFLRNKFGN